MSQSQKELYRLHPYRVRGKINCICYIAAVTNTKQIVLVTSLQLITVNNSANLVTLPRYLNVQNQDVTC